MKEPLKTRGGAGQFGYQTCVGTFEPSVESAFPTTTHFGLTQESSYYYGTFKDEDGNDYTMLRRMYWDYTPHFMPVLQTNAGGQPALMPHPAAMDAYQGIIVQKIENGVHIMEGQNPMAKQSFTLRRTKDGIYLKEGDLIELEGKIVGPAMNWYSPDAEDSAMYMTHLHYCEGTILGKKVKGLLGWDPMYLPAGKNWNTATYYRDGIVGAWNAPAQLFDDGSLEVGNICHATRENWGFAMYQNQDGPIFCTTNITATNIEKDENSFPVRIDYDIDGEHYVWRAIERGQMHFAFLQGGGFRGSEGTFQHIDDKRKVVCGTCWLDFFDENMDQESVIT